MASLVLKCAYENIALLISRNIDHSTQSILGNSWEKNEITRKSTHRCARLTWITCITWLPCISSITFIPCLICITCITWITCITCITWLSITSLNSLLIRIFKMYNLPIEANLASWISFQPIVVKLTSWIWNRRINNSQSMRKSKRSRHRGLQLWRVSHS